MRRTRLKKKVYRLFYLIKMTVIDYNFFLHLYEKYFVVAGNFLSKICVHINIFYSIIVLKDYKFF